MIKGETDHQFFGRLFDWWTTAVLAGDIYAAGTYPVRNTAPVSDEEFDRKLREQEKANDL